MKWYAIILFILLPSLVHAQPSIRFESESHDFGNIKQGELLEFAFEFINSGSEDLFIKGITAS